jgi:Protein of unknown function (DUF4232)
MAESQAMKPATALLAVLAAATLAACGSSNTTTNAAAPAVSSTTTTSGPGTPTGGTSTATTSTKTTAAGPPACVASMLALSYLGGQGATGHGELGFALRNTGSAPCHTYGYPGVLFLSKSGQGLTTATMRTTHDFFGPVPAVALVVAPGQDISFRLGVTHGINSSAGCTTAYAVQVIPPDDTATLKTTIPNGAYECGTATVSPLRPGQSAYP